MTPKRMKKSYSQRIARVFEIANYFLAPVPIAFGGLILVLAPLLFLPVLLIWIFCAPGLWLAAQYFKHSRGDLDDEKTSPMWIATIVFNGLLLLVNLSFVYPDYNSGRDSLYLRTFQRTELVWIVLVIWWAAAIILSLTALWSEYSRRSRPL